MGTKSIRWGDSPHLLEDRKKRILYKKYNLVTITFNHDV